MDGMGNPPCPVCGGMSKRIVDPRDEVEFKPGPRPEWSPEMEADLKAFHGRRKYHA